MFGRIRGVASAAVCLGLAAAAWDWRTAVAQAPAAQPGAGAAPAAAAQAKCKLWKGKQCCAAEVMDHLPREAVFSACGESDATFLGEKADKDTCKYVFKVEGQKEDDTYVQVYAPKQKDVPATPQDPFFSWKKVGKVFVTDRAKSPKAAPILVASTGLWLPGAGFFVSVNASTRVCTKAEAMRLAKALK